jgi:hypothetical protein
MANTHPISQARYGLTGQRSSSGFRTKRELHWEFLRLRTGFGLSSSCINLPCYALNLNRNSFCVMRWPQIDLGAQDLNDIQRPNHFQQIAGSKVLDEYYNTYLRK